MAARRTVLAALAALVLAGGSTSAQEPTVQVSKGTIGTIERLDPRLDDLVPRAAALERLAEGFDWSEGPVWDPKEQRLLFSDVPLNVVYQWREARGVRVFLKPSGYTGAIPRGGEPGSNGLLLDPQGRLVLCQHGDRRVARLEPDGSFKVLADRYRGKRLNSPNDGVYHSNGDLYFTDPPYGLLGLNDDLSQRHRPLPRREDSVRRQLRPEAGDLDGLRREGRRHAGRRAGLLRRHRPGRGP
jgi:gluconolactonase